MRVDNETSSPTKNRSGEALDLYRSGRLREAEASLVESDQNDPNLVFLLAQVRNARGRWSEALAAIQRFEAFGLKSPEASLLRGNILRELDCFTEADAAYDEALALRPNDAICLSNRAALRVLSGRLKEAQSDLENALKLRSDFADASFHMAGICLQRGDFTDGWQLYESRLHTKLAPKFYALYPPEKRWKGLAFSLTGKRLLVYGEQGLGDVIQFSRFIPALLEMGGEVICQIPKTLHRLFSARWPSLILADSRSVYHAEFDWHCSLMSLPYLMDVNVPPAKPWLGSLCLSRSRDLNEKPRVGVVWSGKSSRDLERYSPTRRSMSLSTLAELVCSEVSFVSLQPQTSPEERDLMAQLRIQDVSEKLTDFYETAALISTLDLVISIDTSVIHLAGGMGVPAWVALPKVTDYRWAGSSFGSAWYPHIQVFRQAEPGDWSVPVQQMASALRQKLRLV